MTATDLARVGIIDRNPTVLARAARIVRAAAGLAPVAADSDPSALRPQLAPDTHLLVCDGADLDLALEWSTTRFPEAAVVCWSHGPMAPLIAAAARHVRVKSVLGWPSFLSMPRPWELALAVRRALAPSDATLHLSELFAGAPATRKFRPRTSADRDQVTTDVAGLAERAGATARLCGKLTEVCHELIMNAMYDAPVNHYGEPRYAHDRRAAIELDDHEIPVVRFATDGTLAAIQVADPFGRLTRRHVLAGVTRGQAAAHAEAGAGIIDASHGGAGLGLWRIYAASAVTIVDVIPGHTTSVTAVLDLDVGPREARTMPSSLHLFDRSEL